MNKFKITIEISTFSEAPEEWITDAITDEMETGEEFASINIESISKFSYE